MMDRCIDILKLREEILRLPHSMPVFEPDNPKETKDDNSVEMAENGIESRIRYVNILKLREEVLSSVPLTIPEHNHTEEVKTVDVNVFSKKQVEAKTHLPAGRILALHTIINFGKVHRCCTMTLTEEVLLTWIVGGFPSAQVAHRKARERWKMRLATISNISKIVVITFCFIF